MEVLKYLNLLSCLAVNFMVYESFKIPVQVTRKGIVVELALGRMEIVSPILRILLLPVYVVMSIFLFLWFLSVTC